MNFDHKFFQNRDCRFFPCHECADESVFNCLFCYCPLYALGDKCGGDFVYNEKGYKNCKGCMKPHGEGGYEYIRSKFPRLSELAAGEERGEPDMGSEIFFAFTERGAQLALMISGMLGEGERTVYAPGRIAGEIDGVTPCNDIPARVSADFLQNKTLIFVGALGIAVRYIAPYVNDKRSDPAVICIDERGQRVIPVLSGHIGGANEKAQRIARLIEAECVITTATDINGVFAIDVYARDNDMYIPDMERAKLVSALLLEGREAGARVSPFTDEVLADNECLLIPKVIIAGVGCKKGTDGRALSGFVRSLLDEHHISERAVKAVVSIDIKAKEMAVKELAEGLDAGLFVYSAAELAAAEGEFSHSDFVEQTTGVDNVCERAVRAFAPGAAFLVKKTVRDGMSVAIGMMNM